MIFSLVSRRTMNTNEPMLFNTNKTNKTNYIMSTSIRSSIPRPVTQNSQIENKSNLDTKVGPKKMKWGQPVWFFLHTIAHKIKNESFSILRLELLTHIYTICSNLPCPDCSKHAKIYLGGINFNNIQTKMDLINMLFEFHNSVNRRKGFEEFNREQLDTKYTSANTNAILNYFVNAFMDKHASPRMIADDIYRARLTYNIQKWFIENKAHFEH